MNQSSKLCLVFCCNLAPEVTAVLAEGSFPDVEMATFPARCIGHSRKDELDLFLEELSMRYDRLEIFSGPCQTIQEKTSQGIKNSARSLSHNSWNISFLQPPSHSQPSHQW